MTLSWLVQQTLFWVAFTLAGFVIFTTSRRAGDVRMILGAAVMFLGIFGLLIVPSSVGMLEKVRLGLFQQ